MAIGFVVPCGCSHKVVVGASQAGQTVACQQCGNTLQVPTLLELRRLEQVEIGQSRQLVGGRAVWRVLLLIGLLMSLVGSVFSLYLLQSWPEPPRDLFSLAKLEKDTMALSPLESLKAWKDLLAGVDASRKAIIERAVYNRRVLRQGQGFWAGLVMAAAGLAIVGGALALRPSRK